ncbi:MAG TPA: homoserine O-acetyltransferase [Actinobacteria bacterium]|nr:homoserine O-acetyltransferase [Actinomycetota bacterium]
MTGVGPVETRFFTFGTPAEPVVLRSGATLPEVTVAYETYGELDAAASNAVLVFHALTGSQHAAGWNHQVPGLAVEWTDECRRGWWDGFIGPGKAIDTDRFFVVAANYLGGCYGTTGPSSIDPTKGVPYGSRFPSVTFADIVDVQMRLLDHLGIERLHAAVGASTGGMLVLSLATRYPDRVGIVVPIASGHRTTALQQLHNFEQIVAIESDPAFAGGDYYPGPGPVAGLRLARMIGHKTFVSLRAMEDRARNEVVRPGEGPGTYGVRTPLESYMWHQGERFVRRFDANSYVRIMEAWQTYDLVADAGATDAVEVFARCREQRFMIFSIDSDVCYYPEEQEELAGLLKAAGVRHRRITVHSEKGHDSFLLEPALYAPHLVDTLTRPWHD